MPNNEANRLTVEGVVGRWVNALETYEQQSWLLDVSGEPLDSSQGQEEYAWYGNVGGLKARIGPRKLEGLNRFDMTLRNQIYDDALRFGIDDWRRDRTGQGYRRVNDLAASSGDHWCELLSTLIDNGAAGACYDGSYFYAADHSEGSSGTQSNLWTKTDVVELQVTSTTAVTEVELANAIMGMIIKLMTLKDDRGRKVNKGARKFLVQVPITLGRQALSVAGNDTIVGTSGAISANPVKGQKDYQISIRVNPELTAGVILYLFRADGPGQKPFLRQNERDPELLVLGPDSEYAKLNREVAFIIECSRAAGYGDWRQAAKGTMTT